MIAWQWPADLSLSTLLTFFGGILTTLLAARAARLMKREDYAATAHKDLLVGWQAFAQELRTELKQNEEECQRTLATLRQDYEEKDKRCNARINELERLIKQMQGWV